MSPEEIKEVLERHKRWIEESKGWSEKDRADLYRADLHGADLRGADLYGANLRGADLYRADLHVADLYRADLYGADLRGANLYGANLRGADLYRADLRGANLYRADLHGADLRGANLRGANLYGANLRGADLRGAENIPFIPYACPDFGIFIGFKKASGYIVVLEIPEDAKRLSAAGRKCRCDKAKVLQIQNIDGTQANIEAVTSNHDPSFIYRVGEVVSVDDFDEDRWNECSTGIHFFINRQEAVEY